MSTPISQMLEVFNRVEVETRGLPMSERAKSVISNMREKGFGDTEILSFLDWFHGVDVVFMRNVELPE